MLCTMLQSLSPEDQRAAMDIAEEVYVKPFMDEQTGSEDRQPSPRLDPLQERTPIQDSKSAAAVRALLVERLTQELPSELEHGGKSLRTQSQIEADTFDFVKTHQRWPQVETLPTCAVNTKVCVVPTSDTFLAGISVRSPQKLFGCIIYTFFV